jgi:serine/threonine protein kinase/CheY-like chemotaxis protein
MKSRVADAKTASASPLVEELHKAGLIVGEDWDALPTAVRIELEKHGDRGRLLARLVEEDLLTQYQANMIGAGKMRDLVLGDYRILDRIGAGDMAVVFRAEHLKSRHEVAIKAFAPVPGSDTMPVLRFFAERKTVAQLRHPNIVNVLDVGEQPAADPRQPSVYYYVMEHVAGQDLEALVKKNGPLPPDRACEVIFQAASALAEAHRRHLVHRNVEPANILITDDGKVKLLDFGLARQWVGRMTEPGTALGTLDYMAPEQAADAHAVDIRADIYGLGATLFWCLTGHTPYTFLGPRARDLRVRLQAPPKAPKELRADVPEKLSEIVLKMLALKPADRYATPQELMQALEPLLPPGSEAAHVAEESSLAASPVPAPAASVAPAEETEPSHVLIVDKDDAVRSACRKIAEVEGLICAEAHSGKEAAEAAAAQPPDLVLLADQLPDQPGLAVLRKIRQTATSPYQKVIMLVGGGQVAVKQILAAGADDYVTKPLDADQLQARLCTARELKNAQDRADRLARQLAAQKAMSAPAPAPAAEQSSNKSGVFGGLRRLFGKK